MWEDLLKIGGDAWESVSEGVTQYVDGWVDAKVSTQQEAAKNPDNLKQIEPKKGQRVDGSTITERPRYVQPIITGVDNTTLLIGGALLLTVVLFAIKGGK